MNPTRYFPLAFWPSEDLNIYISTTFRMPCVWSGDRSQGVRVPGCQVNVLALLVKKGEKIPPEAPRATESRYFQQIEGRPPDIKSAGQTVSYGEKMGLKYLYVKIYDVLGDLKKCAKILSYCK